jgi:hypothetical protein
VKVCHLLLFLLTSAGGRGASRVDEVERIDAGSRVLHHHIQERTIHHQLFKASPNWMIESRRRGGDERNQIFGKKAAVAKHFRSI